MRSLCTERMAPPGPTSWRGKPVPGRVPSTVGGQEGPLECEWDRWTAMQMAHPSEESLYCIMVAQAELCHGAEEALDWARRRTQAFPDSRDAWFFLGIEWFRPLFPEPGSKRPYNVDLTPEVRRERATAALKALEEAKRLGPDDVITLTWAEMAHKQRALSYTVVKRPKTDREKLDAIEARAQRTAAWKNRRAICDVKKLETCKEGAKWTKPCCPPPPYSDAELERDRRTRAALISGSQ